jgi:hypothetical protein
MIFCVPDTCPAQGREIVVSNNSDIDRTGEMVEICLSELNFSASFILVDSEGKEIPCQLTNSRRTMIFPVELRAHSSKTYQLKQGVPSPVAAKTAARHVPERKDDFAWENDFAAYRMYGPALARENPGNGVDLWLKCTDSLIVDKFYADELEKGLSYHVNHGLGLDCYSVGRTLGAGGIAPYTSQLWIGKHYSRYRVVENGPLRSVFVLIYDSVKIDSRYYRQMIEITADAGSILNKAVVRYEGMDDSLHLAAGIVLHSKKGALFSSPNGLIAYAEDAVSDAGIPQGRNYVGVFVPQPETKIVEENNHLLIVAPYAANSDFTYWFGGGWSRWKFTGDNDWINAIEVFARARRSPLELKIRHL